MPPDVVTYSNHRTYRDPFQGLCLTRPFYTTVVWLEMLQAKSADFLRIDMYIVELRNIFEVGILLVVRGGEAELDERKLEVGIIVRVIFLIHCRRHRPSSRHGTTTR